MAKRQEVDVHMRPKWQHHVKIPAVNVRKTSVRDPIYKTQAPYDPQIVSATRVFILRGNQYRKKRTTYKPIACLDDELTSPSFDVTVSLQPYQELSTSGPVLTSKDISLLNPPATSIPSFLTRSHACRSAGLKPIREYMKTAAMRIIATRSGQPYDTHVGHIAAKEEELQKKKQKDMDEMMIVKRVSSETVYKSIGEPIVLSYMTSTDTMMPGSVLQKRDYYLTIRMNATRDKVKAIYQILCVLYNMQLKALRSRVPLKRAKLKLLYKDPFKLEPWEQLKKPLHVKEKKVTRENLSINQESYLNIKPTTTNVLSPESAMNVDSLSSRRFITAKPLDGRISSSSPGSSSRTDQRSVSRRVKQKMRLDNDNSPCRLETWEDLLNVGVKHKQLKVSRHRLPPWQNMSKIGSYLIRKAVASSEADGKEAQINFKQAHLDMMQLKIKAQEDTLQQLHKLDRQRMLKYEQKLVSLSGKLKRVFAHELEKLERINQDVAMDMTLDTAETARWYSQLEKECEMMGAMGDEDTLSWLVKLHNFKGEEMLTSIPNIQEKLCLLVMSAPVYEICFPPTQGAIKFILEQILSLSVSLLLDWLQLRNLPYLYAEPEMSDEVEERVSKTKQFSGLMPITKLSENTSQTA